MDNSGGLLPGRRVGAAGEERGERRRREERGARREERGEGERREERGGGERRRREEELSYSG